MPDVKALEEAIQALPPSALAEFRRWFAEFDSAAWDRQLETDTATGNLDALLAEAAEDYKRQPRRSL
jgi:predicted esterase